MDLYPMIPRVSEVLTEKQIVNLRQLATYLSALPDGYGQFDMGNYRAKGAIVDGAAGFPRKLNDCGTVACALGHGPNAGIAPEGSRTWLAYSSDHFISPSQDETEPYWEWCFSGLWMDSDNTPKGAAARINWMLDHDGIPADWWEQISGDSPLSYEVQ